MFRLGAFKVDSVPFLAASESDSALYFSGLA